MANSFGRVNQALRIDNGLKSAGVLAGAFVLLAAWTAWSLAARVTHYEISESARLEVNGSAYPIQANSSGRLVSGHLTLGRMVEAGEVLISLDDDEQRFSLQEQQTRLETLGPQIAALRSQMHTESDGMSDERRVLVFSRQAATEQYRQAQIEAQLASQEAGRANQLHAAGILSTADTQKAQTAAQSKRAIVETMRASIERLEPELKVRNRDRDVRLKQLLVDIAKLEAEEANTTAAIERLKSDLGRRQLRAPISGRLAESAVLKPGAHISEGQQLGVILPVGRLQVVAEFAPSSALGKVHRGQRASLRLDGFPWAQYGTVPARVSNVASDIRDGKVRVELAVNAAGHSRIPYQHGLPGTVEIEVERLSPAALVLRSAGQMLGAP